MAAHRKQTACRRCECIESMGISCFVCAVCALGRAEIRVRRTSWCACQTVCRVMGGCSRGVCARRCVRACRCARVCSRASEEALGGVARCTLFGSQPRCSVASAQRCSLARTTVLRVTRLGGWHCGRNVCVPLARRHLGVRVCVCVCVCVTLSIYVALRVRRSCLLFVNRRHWCVRCVWRVCVCV